MQIEDRAGNVTQSESVALTIDTTAPNLPYLDLITDTGISDTDNITDTDTPLFTITANDTLDGGLNPVSSGHQVSTLRSRWDGRGSLAGGFVCRWEGFSEQGFFTLLSRRSCPMACTI